MQVPSRTDVVVIGGGAVGCSIAYYLSQRGKSVTLFEQRNLGSGASGRCGGMVLQLHGRELNIGKIKGRLQLTRESIQLFPKLALDIGDFEFRQVGSLDIAFTEAEREHIKRLVAFQKRAGDNEIQLLDSNETKELMPALGVHITGARYRPTDGNLNPFKLIHNLVLAAIKHGARFFTHTKVHEIVEEAGQVTGVITDRGLTRANWVVNATNAWASQLTKEFAVAPLREMAFLTERLPPIKAPNFEAGHGDVFTWGTTQTVSGNILMGGPSAPALRNGRYNYYDEIVPLSEVIRCGHYLTHMFPSLRNVNILRCWAGTSAFTPDVIPSIGPFPCKKGLVVAAGFAAGMSHAPATGRIVADYIVSGKLDLAEIYDPGRFLEKEIVWPPDPYDFPSMADFVTKRQNDAKVLFLS